MGTLSRATSLTSVATNDGATAGDITAAGDSTIAGESTAARESTATEEVQEGVELTKTGAYGNQERARNDLEAVQKRKSKETKTCWLTFVIVIFILVPTVSAGVVWVLQTRH